MKPHLIIIPCVKEDFKSMPEMLEHIKSCLQIEFNKLKIRKKKEATIHFSKITNDAVVYMVKEVLPVAAKERNYGGASDPQQAARKKRSRKISETDWGEISGYNRGTGYRA